MIVNLDARCRGSLHVRKNKPLQDFSASMTDSRKTYGYALVADGHGGERYIRSEIGSEIGVKCTVEAMNNVLKELLNYIKNKDFNVIDKSLKNLCSRILVLWREKVRKHFDENPLTENELELCEKLKISVSISEDNIVRLYGSTLLAAVYFENFDFWFTLQIGDGKTVIIKNDDSVSYPIPEDEDQGYGMSNSLCGKTASEKFYYAYGFEKIAGICVMSDGMTDSFEFEKLPDFLVRIKNNALQDIEKTKEELTTFLPKLSEQGSQDDISIAGLFVKEEKKFNFLDKFRKLI